MLIIDIVKKDTKITDQNMALDNKDTAIQSKDKKITEVKGKVKAAMEKSFAMQAEMFKMLTHAGMDSKGVETMFQTFNTSVFPADLKGAVINNLGVTSNSSNRFAWATHRVQINASSRLWK